MPVSFNYLTKVNIANRTLLKGFILSIFRKELKRAGNVHYIFCTDEYLLEINKLSLNHDYYTDIITFDLSMPGQKEIDAEIYISIDRVRENAKSFSTAFSEELLRVIFHGVLHLCGYKDKTTADEATMRKRENHYIKLYSKLLP